MSEVTCPKCGHTFETHPSRIRVDDPFRNVNEFEFTWVASTPNIDLSFECGRCGSKTDGAYVRGLPDIPCILPCPTPYIHTRFAILCDRCYRDFIGIQ